MVVNDELNYWYLPRMCRFDVLDQLRRIKCPTLVLRGSHDPAITAETALELHGALPPGLATLVTIEDAGHFPWKDAPDQYWQALTRFVAGSVPAEAAGTK